MDHIERLAETIRNGGHDESIGAVSELAAQGGERALMTLTGLLEELTERYERRFVLHEVIRALGKLGAPEAEQALLKALESPFYAVQKDALSSLASVNGKNEEVISRIGNILEQDVPAEVKLEGVRAMAHAHTPGAVRTLNHAAREDPREEIKEEAVRSLGTTGRHEAVPALMDLYYREADDRVRHEVIQALAGIATTASVEFLINALDDPRTDIRACVASALGEARNALAEIPLNNLLTDPEESVRKAAARALGLIRFLPR